MSKLSNFIDPVCSFFAKFRITKKQVSIGVLVLFILSFIPIFVMSFYNVPSFDDYTFGVHTHKAWIESGSILAVFSAAIKTVVDFYMNWQGFYSANFVASLNPFVISENLYFICTFLVIIPFTLAIIYMAKKILKLYFNADFYDVILIVCPLLLLFFQFIPSAAEWLFWYDAGQGMLMYGALFMIIGKIIDISYYNDFKPFSVIWLILLTVFIAGTSSLATFFVLFMLFKIVYDLLNKKSKKINILNFVLLSITILCFIICLIAPGNAVRAEQTMGMPFIKAIIMSFFYSFTFITSHNNSLIFIAILLFVLPVVLNLVRNSQFKFKYPLLVFIISYCLYASRFFNTLYSMSSIGSLRQRNSYFLTEIFLIVMNLFYFIGWLYRKYENIDSNHISLFERLQSMFKRYSIIFIVFVLMFVGLGFFEFGIKETTSVNCTLSIATGEAAQFKSEMKQRLELYKNDKIENVKVKEVTATPYVFMREGLTENPDFWVNRAITKYYSKESIVLDK